MDEPIEIQIRTGLAIKTLIKTVTRNLDILGHQSEMMFGSCFIEAALTITRIGKSYDLSIRRFNVSGQLTATMQCSGLGSCPDTTSSCSCQGYKSPTEMVLCFNGCLMDVQDCPDFPQLLATLSVGNAYTWQVLWDEEIQYSKPRTDAMLELLLKGRSLWIRREDIHHFESLKRTLYLLNGGWSNG